MEDLDALDLGRGREPLDHRAFGGGAGIAVGGHHHGERRVRVPTQVEILQHAVAAGEQGGHEIGHQAQHQHLAFGIAEAHVVLDQLGALLRDHQSGEQHARERRAHLLHGGDRRFDDLLHRALCDVRRHDGRGRIGAHAAGVWALVAVEGAFVILR